MKKIWLALVLVLVLVALTFAVAYASTATQTKCYSFYNGTTLAAKFCLKQTLNWGSSAPYVVSCGARTPTYSAYNGHSITNKNSQCNDHGNYVQYNAAGKVLKPGGGTLYTQAGVMGTTYNGQVNYFHWEKISQR